jgi:hypothetical protein
LDLLAGALDAWVNQEKPPSGAGESDAPIVEGGLLMAGNRIRISGVSGVSVAAALGPVLRRNAAAMMAAVLLAIVPAGVAAVLTANASLHSWGDVAGSAGLSQGDTVQHFAYGPIGPTSSHSLNGDIVAAAGIAAVATALALMLALVVVSLASFLLFGAPAVLVLIGASSSGSATRPLPRVGLLPRQGSHSWHSRSTPERRCQCIGRASLDQNAGWRADAKPWLPTGRCIAPW